jgi:hypothetical protein
LADIIVAGNTSGSITISAPLVAGSGTLTLPTGTDTLVGKATTDTLTNKTLTSPTITGATITVASTAAPAFSAYQSSVQTIATTTYTKIQFQTEEFDTNNNFDSTTNYRFTPTVAGYYQVTGGASTVTTSTTLIVDLYKNGSQFKRLNYGYPTAPNAYGTALIYLNGSTDYVELYVFQGAASQNLSASSVYTYFQAAMIRSA